MCQVPVSSFAKLTMVIIFSQNCIICSMIKVLGAPSWLSGWSRQPLVMSSSATLGVEIKNKILKKKKNPSGTKDRELWVI